MEDENDNLFATSPRFHIWPNRWMRLSNKIEDLILAHGGRVSNWQANKVTDPEVTGIKKGIVLIDPTEVGCPALLRQPRKDGLHFVHWAYPWYCVSNNRTYTDPQSRATKLMFIRDPTDGTGWRFYFESDRGKDTLEWAGTFESNGGEPTGKDEADVIVTQKLGDELVALRKKYHIPGDDSKRVETLDWFKKCLKDKVLEFPSKLQRRLPGRPPGPRTDFTYKEQKHLVEYIAKLRPGGDGRLGNTPYKNLVELGRQHPNFAWANTHGWQAWRDQFKRGRMKDGDYKGELVRDQVERWMEENPLKYGDGGHGADPRIRDTNRRRRRIPARQRASSIGSDFNIEEEEEEDEIPDDNDLDYLGGNFENANPDDGLGTVGETTLINEDEEGDAPPPAKRPKKRKFIPEDDEDEFEVEKAQLRKRKRTPAWTSTQTTLVNPTQQARASQRAPTSLRKGRAPAPFGETLDVRDEDEEEEVEDDLGLPDELEVEAEAEVEPAEPQTTRETRRQRQASPEVIASPPLPRSFRQDSRAGRAAGRGKQKATDIPAVEFIDPDAPNGPRTRARARKAA